MRFVARGIIGPGVKYALVGQYTYITMLLDDHPAWDGEHKMALFATSQEALTAAHAAAGPAFRMPRPETIEAVEVTVVG
jgi:hypothetical protein